MIYNISLSAGRKGIVERGKEARERDYGEDGASEETDAPTRPDRLLRARACGARVCDGASTVNAPAACLALPALVYVYIDGQPGQVM